MNQFPRKNKTDVGTVFGALALVLIGVPIILCLGCGFGAWALAGFPGTSGWNLGKASAWQRVVDERRRMHGELITEINNMAANPGQIPASDLQRLQDRGYEVDRKVQELANEALRKYGPPPANLRDALKSTAELEQAMANLRSSRMNAAIAGNSINHSGQSFAERMAQQRAEAEQRAAQYRADNERRAAEQQAREQQMNEQRAAAARAQEQAMRERLNSLGSAPVPQPFFNNGPQPTPQQPVVEAPPGFPCTNLSQIKPKDLVFVKSLDKWYPAVVLLKRGTNVTISYTTNQVKEVVLIDRIRLQVESDDDDGDASTPPPPAIVQAPVVRPEVQRLPPGFRPTNPPRAVKTKDDEEAENLLTIKPNKDPAEAPITRPGADDPAPTVTPPSKPAAAPPPPVTNYRIWTNDAGRTLEAELIGFEFDVVLLKKKDGTEISLQIGKLSAADQAYVREKYK